MRGPTNTIFGVVLILACAFNAPARSNGAKFFADPATLTASASRSSLSQRGEAGNGEVRLQAPLLTGQWEGEILFPGRHSVFLADLERGQGFLSTHGATPFPLSQRRLAAGELLMELHLGHEVVRFSVVDGEAGLRGTAVVTNTEGRVTAEGAALLRRLPILTKVHSRVEAWRQDLEVVLSRFFPYDKSLDAAARAAMLERIERLKDDVARKSDAELSVELARTIALGGNAPTRLYLVRNRTEVPTGRSTARSSRCPCSERRQRSRAGGILHRRPDERLAFH